MIMSMISSSTFITPKYHAEMGIDSYQVNIHENAENKVVKALMI